MLMLAFVSFVGYFNRGRSKQVAVLLRLQPNPLMLLVYLLRVIY